MTLAFTLSFKPITLESLAEELTNLSDSPEDEAEEYLSFY